MRPISPVLYFPPTARTRFGYLALIVAPLSVECMQIVLISAKRVAINPFYRPDDKPRYKDRIDNLAERLIQCDNVAYMQWTR